MFPSNDHRVWREGFRSLFETTFCLQQIMSPASDDGNAVPRMPECD
jgi:hypothetical protein